MLKKRLVDFGEALKNLGVGGDLLTHLNEGESVFLVEY